MVWMAPTIGPCHAKLDPPELPHPCNPLRPQPDVPDANLSSVCPSAPVDHAPYLPDWLPSATAAHKLRRACVLTRWSFDLERTSWKHSHCDRSCQVSKTVKNRIILVHLKAFNINTVVMHICSSCNRRTINPPLMMIMMMNSVRITQGNRKAPWSWIFSVWTGRTSEGAHLLRSLYFWNAVTHWYLWFSNSALI